MNNITISRDAYLAALHETEMAQARMDDAASMHERKVKICGKKLAEITRRIETTPKGDAPGLEAILQAKKDFHKLCDAASRAERARSDVGLEFDVAIAKLEAADAFFERCKAALTEQAEADVSG